MSNLLFKYQEKDNDETKKIILDEEKQRGFEHTKPLFFDESYITLYNELLYNIKDITREISFEYKNVDINYVKKSIKLWKKFGFCLQPILYLHNIDEYENNKVKAFSKASTLRKVDKIPVEFEKIEDNAIKSYVDIIKISINEYIFNFVNKIVVSDINNYISSCIYNHEIVHTQQLYNTEFSNSILDDETLPIFFEEFFAYYLDSTLNTLNNLRNRRLYYLFDYFYEMFFKKNMNYKEVIITDMYIKSTMQAISMFNIYLSGNYKIKKEMLKEIRKIFSYDKTLQEVLLKYEVELNMVDKDVNKLRRIIY